MCLQHILKVRVLTSMREREDCFSSLDKSELTVLMAAGCLACLLSSHLFLNKNESKMIPERVPFRENTHLFGLYFTELGNHSISVINFILNDKQTKKKVSQRETAEPCET